MLGERRAWRRTALCQQRMHFRRRFLMSRTMLNNCLTDCDTEVRPGVKCMLRHRCVDDHVVD